MFKKIAIAATLAMLASSSFAAGPFYAGADVSSTKIDDVDDRENGFGGFVGYTFTENFAVEGAYRRVAKVEGVKVDQAALSVIGTLPVGNGFGVFGRLGYNRLTAEGNGVDESESKALYGAGVSYAFSPTISGRVEVQRTKPELTGNVTSFIAGVAFRF